MESYIENLKGITKNEIFQLNRKMKNRSMIRRESGHELARRIIYVGAIDAWLTYPEEVLQSKTVFVYLYDLDSFIGKDFSREDYYNTLFYIVKRNIEVGILNENVKKKRAKLSARALIRSHYFTEVERPTKNSEFYRAFSRYYKDGLFEQTDKNVVRILTKEGYKLDFSSIQEAHRIIRDHYLNKPNSFNKDDIVLLCYAFGILGVSVDNQRLLEEYLTNSYEKRERREHQAEMRAIIKSTQPAEQAIKVVNVKPIKANDSDIRLLSRRVTNEIYRELANYYDFDSCKAIRYLTVNEIVYCISLLKKLSMSKDKIDDFIFKVEKFNRLCKVSPVVRYSDLAQKLEFYSDNEQVMNILNELREAYASIIPGENDPFYEEFIASGLNEILGLIPDTHEYEYNASLTLDSNAS